MGIAFSESKPHLSNNEYQHISVVETFRRRRPSPEIIYTCTRINMHHSANLAIMLLLMAPLTADAFFVFCLLLFQRTRRTRPRRERKKNKKTFAKMFRSAIVLLARTKHSCSILPLLFIVYDSIICFPVCNYNKKKEKKRKESSSKMKEKCR